MNYKIAPWIEKDHNIYIHKHVKREKNEGHDIFARKTNNKLTMLVYTNPTRKKD